MGEILTSREEHYTPEYGAGATRGKAGGWGLYFQGRGLLTAGQSSRYAQKISGIERQCCWSHRLCRSWGFQLVRDEGLESQFSALSAGGLWVWITVPWGQCHPSLLWVLSAGCPVLSHPENNRGWKMSPT